MCGFGSSRASAPSTQFSTQSTTADPRAAAMYGQAFGAAEQAANRPFTPYSYDPSAFVAQMNPVQLQATQNIFGYQGAADPYYRVGAGLAGMAGMTTAPQVVGQYMSPFMSQVIDPTRQAIEQQQAAQRSQQQAEQIKAGAFGQERGQLMRAVLAGQQNLGLGQALSPLYQTGYGQALGAAQTDLQRQLQAGQIMGGLGAGYQAAGLEGAQALMGAGTLGQQTQQAGLKALYDQFLMQQAYPFQTAQYLASVAGALGPQYGSTTSGYQTSMTPLSYMGMPMSDRRLKEGAEGEKPEVVGQTHDGKNIYRYRLINPDTGELGPVQIGLMADEVEETNPDAIGDYKGFKTLDYEKATDDSARMGGGVMGPGDYAAGGGVYGGMGYVPSVNISASRGLQPASLSFMSPEREEKKGLGDTLKSALDIYKTGKGIYGEAGEAGEAIKASNLGDKLGLSILPSKYHYAYGGSAEDEDGALKSYVPEAELQPGRGLEPAKLSFGHPEEKRETDYLGMAKDIGSLGMMAAKAIPYLATLSDPRLKMGVRPAARDGMGIRPDDEGLDYMARTLVREAGGEGEKGMEAVADVIRNRLQSGHYGESLQDVVTAPKQFSPWNPEARGTRADPRLVDPSSELYQTARGIGERVMGGAEDVTGGATHFYNPDLASPKWGEGLQGAQVIGHHRFGRADAGAHPLAYAEAERPALGGAREALDRIGGGTMRSDVTEAPVRGVAPSGLAGMLRGAAPEGMGEKAADFLTSERFLVPLLAGIGTAASSQSRFLAPALLQGLGAGAKVYGEMGQQEFERQKAREMLGLEAQKVGLSGREIGLKEQEIARRVKAAEASAKALSGGAGAIPYGSAPVSGAPLTTAPPPVARPSGMPEDVTPEFPITPKGMPAPTPPRRPSPEELAPAAPPAAAAPPVAQNPMATPSHEFWSNVDPQSNPHILDATAQRFENAAIAAGQSGDPEYAKTLISSAQQYRNAASGIRKEGRVLTNSGEVVLIPGFGESAAKVKKMEAQAEADVRIPTEKAIKEAEAQIGRKFAPVVSPTGTKFMPPEGEAASPPITAPIAPPENRPTRAAIEPKSGRVSTSIPPAPPGGGMLVDPSLPPGAKVTELSPQNAAIVENDKKFFGDFMERMPSTEVALQRYKNIAQALKIAESGSTADQRLALSTLAATMGYQDLAEKVSQGDPAAMELVKKNAINAVLDTLKAATPRFAQQEFTRLSDQGVPAPDRLPRTNFEMTSEAIGTLERQKAFARDWSQAQKEGWVSPTSFWQSWSEANPLDSFIKSASRQLGNFKGMPLPPLKDWAEGAIYVVPPHMSTAQASHMSRRGLKSGDMFMFGGMQENGEPVMRPISKSEAFSAHRGVQ